MRLQRCSFDAVPRLEGGQFEALELDECRLPGLRAHSARVTQEFKVTRCTVNGTLDLRSLGVGTHLSLERTTVRPAPGEAGVTAQSVAVDESLWATDLDCAGAFHLNNARVRDPLVLIGSLLGTWPPAPVGGGPYPRFQPVIYTLDLLLPLVDLSQERAYGPSGAMQWVAIVLVGSGWLLATTVAAGAGRILRRT